MNAVFDDRIRPWLEYDGQHMAALLKSPEDLPQLLVPFFQLGEGRNGWLVHGSLPGEAAADRERLQLAGLDVAELEACGRLSVMELDLSASPEAWVQPWSARLEERLASGYEALWWSRFPIGPTEGEVSDILPFEEAWMRCFTGRPVFTLCPYIVERLGQRQRIERAARVGTVHDRVVDAEDDQPVR